MINELLLASVLSWGSPVYGTASGFNEAATRSSAETLCDQKIYKYRDKCAKDGGKFVPQYCFVRSCAKDNSLYVCDAHDTLNARPLRQPLLSIVSKIENKGGLGLSTEAS